jgi:molybdenum cofactor cytidylyltransferase
MDISVVILAAGEASRMGDIKQLLSFNNSTLLQTTINHALKSRAKKVYVVLGANSDIVKDKISDEYVTIIQNLNWQEGLSSSIISIINHLENSEEDPDALLVMLADQPKVDSSYLNKLISLYQKKQQAIIASAYGDFNGVPALFPKKYFGILSNLKGDKGAKKLLNDRLVDVISYIPKSAEILIDIDSPEDYKNLIKKTL